jgi:tRNA threonylcarbamoyladenosine biosynthesis protein TsaE
MNNTYKFVSHSDAETVELAENLEAEKFPNMVICLNGDLGSGKTVFTKGFAGAMGINEITSPTFSIIKEYYGELPLYHMDVYRTNGDVDALCIEEYFHRNGVTIIEWSDMIENYLPSERLEININIVDENKRVILIKAYGEKYQSVCDNAL